MTTPLGVINGLGQPKYGVVLALHLGDKRLQTEIEVAAAATSDSTVPATSTATRLALKSPGIARHTHFTPDDTNTRHYRARHIFPGYCAGSYTDWICARPIILSIIDTGDDGRGGTGGDDDLTLYYNEGRRRNDTLYEDDRRLNQNVFVRDTASDFGINRHNESDQEEHDQDVTFQNTFEGTPRVTFIPQNAKVYSTGLGSGALFMDMAALDPTPAGFTVRAVLATTNSSTQTTDGWSTAQNTGAPENGDVTLTADGDVCYSNLEDANSNVTTYNAYFDVDTTNMDVGNTLTVQVSYNSGATSTTFTLGASKNYGSGITSTDEKLSFVAALGSSYDLRGRITYSTAPGPLTAAEVVFHGEDNGQPGVVFNTPSGGSEETMTPSTGQTVLWQATEAPN